MKVRLVFIISFLILILLLYQISNLNISVKFFDYKNSVMRTVRDLHAVDLNEVFKELYRTKHRAKKQVNTILQAPGLGEYFKNIEIEQVQGYQAKIHEGQIPTEYSFVYKVIPKLASNEDDYPIKFFLYYKSNPKVSKQVPFTVAVRHEVSRVGVVLPSNYSTILHNKLLQYLNSNAVSLKKSGEYYTYNQDFGEVLWVSSSKDKQEFEKTAKLFPFLRYFLKTRYNLFDSVTIRSEDIVGYDHHFAALVDADVVVRGTMDSDLYGTRRPVPASNWIVFMHEVAHSWDLDIDMIEDHLEKFHPKLSTMGFIEGFPILWEFFISKQIVDSEISSKKQYPPGMNLFQYLKIKNSHPISEYTEGHFKDYFSPGADEIPKDPEERLFKTFFEEPEGEPELLLVADVNLFIKLGLIDQYLAPTRFNSQLTPTDSLGSEYFLWLRNKLKERGF